MKTTKYTKKYTNITNQVSDLMSYQRIIDSFYTLQ